MNPAPSAPYASLYLHFPFCESKCHYCDFYSIGREKTAEGDASTFEKALIREIELRGKSGVLAPELDTIFLGGGTPSMTPPDSMERIFAELFKYTSLKDEDGAGGGTEWTMEANPSSIEREQFRRYRALGLNRVSMGVQSLKNDHLSILGRVHDEAHALRALETVFEAGFNNVSTDLLCGVPGQSLDDLRSHMEKLTAFPITHLSIYLLTLPPHHKMYRDLPNEDEQLRHLLLIDEFMREKGFRHYEISNFARNGLRARHNLVYWQGGSYLGFGPSAHSYAAGGVVLGGDASPVGETSATGGAVLNGDASTAGGARFKNFSSLHKYARTLLEDSALPVEWTESLNPDQLELEKWMLAIRLDEGFPLDWLARDSQKKKAEMLTREGLLESHPTRPGHWRATARGFALSDAIVKTLA
jgi:oxygen-independent coproporphyrinogen-3 oxidase